MNRRLAALSLATSLLLVTAPAARATGPGAALAVIVNTGNPIDNLTMSDLRDLLLGRQATWSSGKRVTLVQVAGDTPERAAVLKACCRMSAGEYDRAMLQSVFTGQVSSGPKVVSSPLAVIKFVFNVPGSLGIVPAEAVPDTVKAVRVEGRVAVDADYPLKIK